MEGLIEEGKEIIDEDGEASVIDAALIAAAQRVEHYEMAGYGCVRTFANLLGLRGCRDAPAGDTRRGGRGGQEAHRTGRDGHQRRGRAGGGR